MTTNFSSMDYKTLRDMAKQLDAARITAAGQSLVDAAGMLRDATLALYLKREGVVWSGPAADQFGTWTQDLTNSTFQLADFVHNQGTRLTFLGGEITTAVARIPQVSDEELAQNPAMVAYSTTVPSEDVAATSAALAASDKKIADAQVAAASQMRSIAQTYEGTVHVMLLEPRPEFRQPADVHDITKHQEYEDFQPGAGASASPVTGVAEQTSRTGGRSTGSTAYAGGTVAPDNVAWQPSSGYTGSGTPAVVTTPALGTNAVQFGVPPSPLSGATPDEVSLSTAGPRSLVDGPALAPPATVDTTAGSTAGTGAVPGGFVGTLPTPGATGVTGKTTGAARSPVGGTSPRSTEGIVGGTPRPGQHPQEGRVGGARTGMPMSGGVAGPAPTTGGGTTGRSATGRPFMPGGAVGGAPANSTPGNRRQFTSGGSGLRSSGTPSSGASGPATGSAAQGRPVGGMHGGAAPAPAGTRGRRERADYLAEDDEYWNGRRNDGVPPVIG